MRGNCPPPQNFQRGKREKYDRKMRKEGTEGTEQKFLSYFHI